MRDVLVHRGPDDAGIYTDQRVALGHRRLSIVDLSGGHQPISRRNDRYWIVYNGEVYNHLEIRGELESLGSCFHTRCDTEAVLEAFAAFGRASVPRLRGMFAYAVWDKDDEELTLVRDRFGIKPLYYSHLDDGTLVFGSEIKAILASGFVPGRLRKPSLPDLMANHATSDDTTLLEGVRRLPPGHTLSWRDGRVTVERYWKLSMEVRNRGSRAQLAQEYRERLWEAVRLRLMADVPLGVFLSGGIDSAAITAAMASQVGPGIKSFSVAFEEREANELQYARQVAERCGTNHHEVTVRPSDFVRMLPRLIWHEDEPIAHPSSIPLHFVSSLAAEHVKVVLTGEGSDETLAGYFRYRATLWSLKLGGIYERTFPRSARGVVRRMIEALPRTSVTRRRLLRTFLGLDANVEALYFENFAVFGKSRLDELLSSEVKEAIGSIDPYPALWSLMDESETAEVLNQLLYTDMSSYLHELLMKQDQMSMSTSLESRVPFLDHELVEWASALPLDMKLRGLTTKAVLRDAVRDDLPPSILSRKKMGFPVPVGRWFRTWWLDGLRELLLTPPASERGLFDTGVVERLITEHSNGHQNHNERLWMLVNLEIWHRVVLEGGCPDTLGADLAAMAPNGE